MRGTYEEERGCFIIYLFAVGFGMFSYVLSIMSSRSIYETEKEAVSQLRQLPFHLFHDCDNKAYGLLIQSFRIDLLLLFTNLGKYGL